MKIVFAAKKGYWGENGMCKISCLKWLEPKLIGVYITKVRIMKG
jgi:hypothetical protein